MINHIFDNDIYRQNLRTLSERYPELAEKIGRLSDDGAYRVVLSERKELPNLIFQHRRSVGMYYDNTDPLAYCVDYVDALNLKNARVIFFLGTGLCYQLAYVLQQLSRKLRIRHAVIVEKDLGIFKKAMETVDLRPYLSNPDIEFFVGLTPHEIASEFYEAVKRKSMEIYFKTFKFVVMPAAHLLHGAYYREAVRALSDECDRVIASIGNDPFDGLLGLQNTLRNAPKIVDTPGIKLLYEKFRNRPAIVIATGPSLKKNMHLLKDLYDRALLISVDASLKVLMDNGIRPHFVTSIERVPGVADLVEGIKNLDHIYYTVYDGVSPETLTAYEGPQVMVSRDYAYYEWLGLDCGRLRMGPSTANMAYKIAEALGCNPIILIGQDLSFGSDGYTHAKGALPNETMADHPWPAFEIPGNDGRPVKTTVLWYDMLKYYEYDIARFKGTCVNATEGGARINGAKVMKLEQAVDEYCTEPFYPIDIVKGVLSTFSNGRARDRLRYISEKIETSEAAFDRMSDYCQEGLKLIDDFDRSIYGPLAKGSKAPLEKTPLIEKYSNQALDLMKSIAEDPLTDTLLTNSIQSYHFPFEMETNHLPDQYELPVMAQVAAVHQKREWFATVGQIILSTKHYLLKQKRRIDAVSSSAEA